MWHPEFQFHKKYPKDHPLREIMRMVPRDQSHLGDFMRRLIRVETWEAVKERGGVDAETVVWGYKAAREIIKRGGLLYVRHEDGRMEHVSVADFVKGLASRKSGRPSIVRLARFAMFLHELGRIYRERREPPKVVEKRW